MTVERASKLLGAASAERADSVTCIPWVVNAEAALAIAEKAHDGAEKAGDDFARDSVFQALQYLRDAIATKRGRSTIDLRSATAEEGRSDAP